jgi:hypothetical protein
VLGDSSEGANDQKALSLMLACECLESLLFLWGK